MGGCHDPSGLCEVEMLAAARRSTMNEEASVRAEPNGAGF